MDQGDKPAIKQPEKQKMLDELESLSRLLDEDLDDVPSRPIPEDIPVLKSFVDDVPVLVERFEAESSPVPLQKTDSIDTQAGQFQTLPNTRSSGQLDVSFLDKNPLEISPAVRQHRATPAASPEPAPAAPAVPPAKAAQPAPAPRAPAAPVASPAATPAHATAQAAATQPLSRFQSSSKGENPFLPKSTLDKIRENHANDASSELRKLIENNPLQKLAFDLSPSSREYQQLRQKASQMVNEVIRANMPRLEAELRLRLEQEVDRMFKELKKK